ncbi:type II secretion system F family protein [Candidatus Wolfebacteria bacterium]|nr:type II secretion system F family protein [Candidatus Wolfebacteria bacterium]
MKFHYTASQVDGKIVEGDMEVTSYEDVLKSLSLKGLKPVSIKVLKTVNIQKNSFFGQPISISDKVFLTRYLSLMLKAGTDLFKAISILISDLDKPVLKGLLIEIRSNLEKGNPFYTVFAKYPRYFPDVFVNLIKAGEASGNLPEVLDNLSVNLGREQELRNKLKGAFIYPVILLVMSFLILILLTTFAIPRIAEVFLSTGITPPLFSRIVFGLGLFLNEYSLIIFPIFFVIILVLVFFFARTLAGKKTLYYIATKTPVVKNIIRQYALQRFSNVFASLLKAGLPVINAIEITADAVGSEEFKRALLRISREGISKGLTIGEAFRKEPAFPQVVTNLISVSEKAGHIDDVLRTLSEFFESEVDSAVKSTVAFIEPILLLFIGIMIGAIALAIIVPIYQLVGGI